MSKIVFLGVEGSGKTTLTMALAKAFGRHRSEGWYLKPLSRDSFRFLKMLPENLNEGTFPHQTADLRELSWQVEHKDKPITDISILDYPGEIYRLAFLDEKDERDPDSFRQKVAANRHEIDALLNAVKDAERVFVLFNLNDAVDLAGNPRNLDAVWVTNACLHLLKKLNPKPDIQLLLTQADKYRAAGKDLSNFSLDEIDLVGHDHKDVPWRFVSVLDAPESEYGVDGVVGQLVAKPLDNEYLSVAGSFDLWTIDVNRIVSYGCHDELIIGKDYVASITKAVNALAVATGSWPLYLRAGNFVSDEQIDDWKLLEKILLDIDQKLCEHVNADALVDVNQLKSEWGKNLASQIAIRVNECNEFVANEKRSVRIAIIAGVAFLSLVTLLIVVSAAAGK